MNDIFLSLITGIILQRRLCMPEELRGKTKQVYDIVKKSKKVSLQELKKKTNINYNTIRGAVIRLTKRGLIKRIGRGVYELKK